MNIRLTVILGLIVALLLAWFYSLNQSDNSLQNLIKSPDSPEYVGNKMETTIFGPDGKKQYLASADKVEYYTSNGNMIFTYPVVHLFDITLLKTETESKKQKSQDNIQSWKISADQATLTKDNMLYLKGKVIIQSLEPNSRLQRLETESATVNLKTQDIHSDSKVKINGKNFTSTGLKLEGNLQQQIATLKEQVKTYYEVTQD